MSLHIKRQFAWWLLDSLSLENPLYFARRPWLISNFPWRHVHDYYKEGVPFMPLYEFDDHEVGRTRGPEFDVLLGKYLPFVLFDQRMRQNAAVRRKELGLLPGVWGMEYALPYEDSRGHIKAMPRMWSEEIYSRLLGDEAGEALDQKLVYYFQMLVAGGLDPYMKGFEKIRLHATREDIYEYAAMLNERQERLNTQFFSPEDFVEFYYSPYRDKLVNLAQQMHREDQFLARRMRRAIRWEFVGYWRSFRQQQTITRYGRYTFFFRLCLSLYLGRHKVKRKPF